MECEHSAHCGRKGVAIHERALSAHSLVCDAQNALWCKKAFAPLRVPVPPADGDEAAVLLRAHIAANDRRVIDAADDEHRAILAPTVILDVRHPRPHDFTGVWISVDVRRVLQAHSAQLVGHDVTRGTGAKLAGAVLVHAELTG